ncbi:MAG: AAA family ATPase, partial [Desulfamplus sp.]|nr:AAA family ATPase [Desulfamplus sp.]
MIPSRSMITSESMISNTVSEISESTILSGSGRMIPSRSVIPNAMISRAMWEEYLLSSPDLVVTGSGNTPMVLDNGRLYLRRYWQYTVEVANDIARRIELCFPVPDDLSSRLDELFVHLRSENERNKTEIHWQSVAAALAARGGFTIISGGPGTGKTTTVVQILALLQGMAMEQGQKLRIHLAAPTGKAAARLTESIGGAVGRIKLPDHIRDSLPTQVTTIHKLLGSRSGTRHFIHTKSNKLYLDLLVVD